MTNALRSSSICQSLKRSPLSKSLSSELSVEMSETGPISAEKIESFQKSVDDFRREFSTFFGTRPQASEKDQEDWAESERIRIKEEHASTVQEAKGLQKAECFTLLGRLHNAGNSYSKQAEEYLNKAVKMDPKCVTAWNELGECYFNNNQVAKALNCFQSALKYVKDKTALRNMSKVLRSSSKISAANLQDSIKKAQEALEIDLDDGASWFNLGNAYLTVFFHGNQPENILRKALFCYKKALLDETQQTDPDLHYSLAEASRYTEEYQTALDGYSKCYQLNQTWKVPAEKAENLETYLREVNDAVQSKGKTKPRKLEQLIKSTKPHHTTVFNSPNRLVVDMFTSTEKADDWHAVLKVVATFSQRSLSFTCCAIDANLDCLAVSVFNLAESKTFTVGDTLTISKPEIRDHSVKLRDGTEISYKSLRVSDPRSVAVNGRLIEDKWLSPVGVVSHLYNS